MQEYNNQFDPLNGVAMNDDWVIPSLVTGSMGLFQGGKTALGIAPYLKDIWKGKHLFLRKPYAFMDKLGQKQHIKDGKNYFKEQMVGNPVNTKWGIVDFKGNRATETNPEHIWQYPFVRYNLSKAKENTKIPNYKSNKRTDSDYFNNVKVNMFGKKYDYQIRNNISDKSQDFYNIKLFEILKNDIDKLKQSPELYNKFLELNNKKGL